MYNVYLELVQSGKANNQKHLKEMRAKAFGAPFYSAPLLNPDGSVMGLQAEKKTLELVKDLKTLCQKYKKGTIFFAPPLQWSMTDRFEREVEKQGVKRMPLDASDEERAILLADPLFYINFVTKLQSM